MKEEFHGADPGNRLLVGLYAGDQTWREYVYMMATSDDSVAGLEVMDIFLWAHGETLQSEAVYSVR